LRTAMPVSHYLTSNVLAAADIRNKKRTGAMLLPWWTTTLCRIS
jgi:hypothetical protein